MALNFIKIIKVYLIFCLPIFDTCYFLMKNISELVHIHNIILFSLKMWINKLKTQVQSVGGVIG